VFQHLPARYFPSGLCPCSYFGFPRPSDRDACTRSLYPGRFHAGYGQSHGRPGTNSRSRRYLTWTRSPRQRSIDCTPSIGRATVGGIFPLYLKHLPRHGAHGSWARSKIFGKITFSYLDADDPQTDEFQRTLGFYYQPEIYLLNANGEVLEKWVGFTSEEELETAFAKHLK
jgi:hypothetical protein